MRVQRYKKRHYRQQKNKKMKAFRFLKDKWFYISLIIMLLIVVAVFEITFSGLDRFTRHGTEFPVPDMVGLNYDEATELYKDEFTFILLDSIYVKDFPEGAVYQQNPKPGAMVKKGRNMYVIRTSIAPEIVNMPNLRNLSLRQAMVSLNIAGLKVDRLEFVEYFARNAVIEQKINGEVVDPKKDVVKGTVVTLVVGLGTGSKTTNIPDLVGTNINDVKYEINKASLNLGTEIFIDDGDPEHLFVSRMDPYYSQDAQVPLGSTVNVWYRSDENFDFNWYNHEKLRRDSIAEAWRLKRYSSDTIKYLLDSFNYILRNRSFSYDSLKRQKDKNIRFKDSKGEIIGLDYSEDNNFKNEDVDYKVDPSYFYDE